jgi:hypothetical protein
MQLLKVMVRVEKNVRVAIELMLQSRHQAH